MISKILVALDTTPRADTVFETAADIARQFGAELHMLRIVSVPPEFPPAAAGVGPDPLSTFLTGRAMQGLEALVGRAPGVRFGPSIVRPGEPWRVILDVGEDVDADLIVIGSHGYKGVDRLLGTTAAKVVNMAHRNVLVVHARAPISGLREATT